VPIEKFFDLARIDVLAATNDHIFEAPDNVAVAFGVERCQVTGVHPTGDVNGLSGTFGIVPIALHHAVATRQELTRSARGDNTPLSVDNLHLDVWLHPPDRGDAPLQRVVRGALEADRAGFGHAVGNRHLLHMHGLIDPLHDLNRAGGAGHNPGA
jgi:hypothetical protein